MIACFGSRDSRRCRLARSARWGLLALAAAVVTTVPITSFGMAESMNTASRFYQWVSLATRLTSPGEVKYAASGVPVVDYGYKQGTYVGEQVNPLAVAAAGRQFLLNYQRTGDLAEMEKAENCIKWLEDSVVWNGRAAVWEYRFPTSYVSEIPHYSALAQANILRTLVLAEGVMGEGRYIDLIGGIIASLDTSIADGGCATPIGFRGGKWFAELASPYRSQPPFILNGHMEVLLRLHEYWKSSGDLKAGRLFEAGVIALEELLPQYDAGRWSYYDLEGNWAYDYHYVHIDELQELSGLAEEPVFAEYAERWGSCLPWNPWWARKRFAAYLLNVAILWSVGVCILLGRWLVHRNEAEA